MRVRRALRPDDAGAAFLLHHAAWCREQLKQHAEALPGFVDAQALYEAAHGSRHKKSKLRVAACGVPF